MIETEDAAPVKVAPCPISFHYAQHVHKQLQEMAQKGIIRHSNSPWCIPTVYELHILCVDFIKSLRKMPTLYPELKDPNKNSPKMGFLQ